jgi:hypothetical protein
MLLLWQMLPARGLAGIYLLSEDRMVKVFGSASASPTVQETYSQSQGPDAPFTTFSGQISSNAGAYSFGTGAYGLDVSAYSSSRAFQQSSVSAAGFSFHSDVIAQTWSQLPTWGGSCLGVAESSFLVTFNVTEAQPFVLNFNRFMFAHDYPFVDVSCTLESQDGVLLDLPRTFPLYGQTFSGMLEPGNTYSLSICLKTIAGIPDPLGELGVASADLTFSLVPEPAAGLLLGLGLLSLALRRRSR